MAIKKEYLSVDGEIFGEVTGGVVNFYDREALGSEKDNSVVLLVNCDEVDIRPLFEAIKQQFPDFE